MRARRRECLNGEFLSSLAGLRRSKRKNSNGLAVGGAVAGLRQELRQIVRCELLQRGKQQQVQRLVGSVRVCVCVAGAGGFARMGGWELGRPPSGASGASMFLPPSPHFHPRVHRGRIVAPSELECVVGRIGEGERGQGQRKRAEESAEKTDRDLHGGDPQRHRHLRHRAAHRPTQHHAQRKLLHRLCDILNNAYVVKAARAVCATGRRIPSPGEFAGKSLTESAPRP